MAAGARSTASRPSSPQRLNGRYEARQDVRVGTRGHPSARTLPLRACTETMERSRILAARAKYRRRRDRFESNLTDVEWACLIPMYSPATSQISESGSLNSFRTGSHSHRPAAERTGTRALGRIGGIRPPGAEPACRSSIQGLGRTLANPQVRKIHQVTLSAQERRRELRAIADGTGAAWRQRRAQILLMADEEHTTAASSGMPTSRAARSSGISMVERLRKRCVPEGLETALLRNRSRRRNGSPRLALRRPRTVSAGRESCLPAVGGGMEIVESISKETIRKPLKTRRPSRG